MIMTERMFIIACAFLFGNFLGCYSFEFIKNKNRKHEIHEFFYEFMNLFDEKIKGDKNQ